MCQRDLTRFLRYTGQALLRMLYTSTHEKCAIENCYHYTIYAFNFETQFRNKPIISSKAPTHAVICPLYQSRSNLKTYGERTFSFFAPKIWNSLSQTIRSSTTSTLFKSRLKTHFFREN